MSDTVMATNPLAKGMATSEGKLTAVSVVGGILLSIFGALQPFLIDAQAQHPENRWLGIACLLCGAILSGSSLFGYNKGRALVKSTQIQGLLQMGVPAIVSASVMALEQKASPKVSTPVPAPLSAEAPTPNLRAPPRP